MTGFSNKQRLTKNLPNVSIRLGFQPSSATTLGHLRRPPAGHQPVRRRLPGLPRMPSISGLERGELDPALDELYPNYWHTTDYMHYSVLGPVAVIIEVLGQIQRTRPESRHLLGGPAHDRMGRGPVGELAGDSAHRRATPLRLGERRLAAARPQGHWHRGPYPRRGNQNPAWKTQKGARRK